MTMEIIEASISPDKLFCTGSFSKLLTTYVCLSLLSKKYKLNEILDDVDFFDKIATTATSKQFLKIFQKHIGSRFSLRDICTYYTGLSYTFDVAAAELEIVSSGESFKHQSILDEQVFLDRCKHAITILYPNRCKFHYSELSIIFLGYFIEQVYQLKIEDLYQQYVLNAFHLKYSLFSRYRAKDVLINDLSLNYDYPSVAIMDHGYYCYSNGFFTTLNDMQALLEQLLDQPVFSYMVDVTHARAASYRLMNGLAVEMRLVGDDLIYGYEGLSYSGCNIWAYSTKLKRGYLSFTLNEEEAYKIIYDQQFAYHQFDHVPAHTEIFYKKFLSHYDFNALKIKPFPEIYQGTYQRVSLNGTALDEQFFLDKTSITIRNPERITYDIVYVNGLYRLKAKDGIPEEKIGLAHLSGHHYFYYDGTLYKKLY